MSDNADQLSYEGALAELETLLDAMEDGQVPLADLVEKYGQGTQLLKLCEQRLREAELKVEKLASRGENPDFESIDPAPEKS